MILSSLSYLLTVYGAGIRTNDLQMWVSSHNHGSHPSQCFLKLSSFLPRISDPDCKGQGEVHMWGRNIMMGYLNREDKTTEDLIEDGWLKSGDQGFLDEDGYLYITGKL